MPSASSYTNKIRALTDSRNSKVQYPGSVVTYRPALSLTCDANMAPTVVTIAGVPSTEGYTGDGGPAKQATLNSPQAVCTDSVGNIFIADTDNQCVRKIDTSGEISTLSITTSGTPVTFSSDGTFRAPIGMTIDNNDILYITDTWVNRILVVNSKTGAVNYQIVSDSLSNIRRPYNVWLVGSQLYIANLRGGGGLGTVSVYNLNNNTFSSPVLTFYYPITVAVAPDGSVYSIEQINIATGYTPNRHCVRRYKNGAYSTFAGVPNSTGSSGDGGPATAARLNNPSSVFTDAFGSVYICDTGNGRIRMVSPDGIIQTVVGGGTAYNEGSHPLQIQANPVSMWFDAQGRMYFTETTSTIRRINSVYKPSWWDVLRYEKICKPCNAIVRAPPLPPVPTLLNLQLTDRAGGIGTIDGAPTILVDPSNNFIHLRITAVRSGDNYGLRYLYLRKPNFNGSFVNLQSATIDETSLNYQLAFDDEHIQIDTGGDIVNASIVLVLNFESSINDILRVFYSAT